MNFEAHAGVSKGDICVLRDTNGKTMALKLADPRSYKEWSGCFTYLGA